MKKGITLNLILSLFLWLVAGSAASQSYLGLAINYGDKLTFTPKHKDLLLNRRSFSATFTYTHQKTLDSDFSFMYGVQAGIAGYQLIPEFDDTLSSSNLKDRYPFIEYGNFVGRIEVTLGKIFHIGKRDIFIGLGGGISYYLLFPFTTMSVIVDNNGTGTEVFSAYLESPESGVFSGFAKLFMKTPISKRLDLAFQYSRHWRSILEGEYEFYHTQTPASGRIKFEPQGFSFILLYRLKKD